MAKSSRIRTPESVLRAGALPASRWFRNQHEPGRRRQFGCVQVLSTGQMSQRQRVGAGTTSDKSRSCIRYKVGRYFTIRSATCPQSKTMSHHLTRRLLSGPRTDPRPARNSADTTRRSGPRFVTVSPARSRTRSAEAPDSPTPTSQGQPQLLQGARVGRS